MKRFSRGLTLVELLLVVVIAVCIFLLPVGFGLRNARAHLYRTQCMDNLRQVSLATRVWTRDHGDKFPWQLAPTNGGTMEFTSGPNVWRHFQVMSNELRTPKILLCPTDGSRAAATNFESFNDLNISYFTALGAAKTDPDSLLFGDRNLTNGTSLENGVLQLLPNRAVGWTDKMHGKLGIVVVADGTIEQTSTWLLRSTVTHGANVTNRLLMPILSP